MTEFASRIQVRSVVVAGRVAESLDLQQLLVLGTYRTFHVGADRSLKGRFRRDGPHVAIFRTGRVVISGRTTISDATVLLEAVLKDARSVGAAFQTVQSVRTENIVADVDLGARLELEKVLLQLVDFAPEYEPEVFPGLIARAPRGVTLLVFSTGRVVFTGAKDVEAVIEAAKWLENALAR